MLRVVDRSAAYRHVEELLGAERCVVLDGGIATELQRVHPPEGRAGTHPELWGTWALYRAPGRSSRFIEATRRRL